jgi:hypothetical protein
MLLRQKGERMGGLTEGLGRPVHELRPGFVSKSEAKKARKQAYTDIKESESDSEGNSESQTRSH